jgi:hypothetical protein
MEEIDEKINKFHKNIDDWIESKHVDYGVDDSYEKCREVGNILHLSREDLKNMSVVDYQTAIYALNQYWIYLNKLLAREKAVKTWADQGIWYIITGMEHDKYTKWEEKYHMSIRASPMGIKLQILKTTAEARILATEATSSRLETAIKVLENLSRSKSYDRS